jgi:hypothetical protein
MAVANSLKIQTVTLGKLIKDKGYRWSISKKLYVLQADMPKKLKKKSKHRFGHPDETISSVLGKNKRDNTLTKLGAILSNVLDFLDENHSIKSIE